MNFKNYFGLSNQEKKVLSPNTGSAHHQTVKRTMDAGLERKTGANLVARMHTQKEHLHPKVTRCLNDKKDVKLSDFEANQIKKDYGIFPNQKEPKKAIKQLGVYLYMVQPNQYILTYQK